MACRIGSALDHTTGTRNRRGGGMNVPPPMFPAPGPATPPPPAPTPPRDPVPAPTTPPPSPPTRPARPTSVMCTLTLPAHGESDSSRSISPPVHSEEPFDSQKSAAISAATGVHPIARHQAMTRIALPIPGIPRCMRLLRSRRGDAAGGHRVVPCIPRENCSDPNEASTRGHAHGALATTGRPARYNRTRAAMPSTRWGAVSTASASAASAVRAASPNRSPAA